jgi:hypothetical protein
VTASAVAVTVLLLLPDTRRWSLWRRASEPVVFGRDQSPCWPASSAEHLEPFREASEVVAPQTTVETPAEGALTVTGRGSSVHQERPTRAGASASVAAS